MSETLERLQRLNQELIGEAACIAIDATIPRQEIHGMAGALAARQPELRQSIHFLGDVLSASGPEEEVARVLLNEDIDGYAHFARGLVRHGRLIGFSFEAEVLSEREEKTEPIILMSEWFMLGGAGFPPSTTGLQIYAGNVVWLGRPPEDNQELLKLARTAQRRYNEAEIVLSTVWSAVYGLNPKLAERALELHKP